MDSDDVIRLEDLATVRVEVKGIRRKVLVRSATLAVLSSVGIGLLLYYLKFRSIAISAVFGGAFLVIGAYYYVGWWRHYRAIFSQLNGLEQRVLNGEVIYGSQVSFHSYR